MSPPRLLAIHGDIPHTHVYCAQEMFRQGDRERAMGQPVSPLMDRTKGGVTKSQTGFFSIVALPIYQVSGEESTSPTNYLSVSRTGLHGSLLGALTFLTP